MKISYRGDYALKAVLDLALHYEAGSSTINDIATRIDAPGKFLELVLLDLKRGGFVESKRGKIGGYFLSKPPKLIKVGDVVRFIDGPIEPIACVRCDYRDCGDLYKCAFRGLWQEVYQSIAFIVDGVTFEDLVIKGRAIEGSLNYSI